MGEAIRKLLIVRQDKLGDLLTTTPALHALKIARPDLHVTVWIPAALEPVLRNNPYIDAIGLTTYRPSLKMCLQHLRKMRRRRFDAAVFVKSRAGTHIPLTWLARIPNRVGSTKKHYGRYLTNNLSLEWDEMHEHEAELSYRVLEACVGKTLDRIPMELSFTEAEDSAARDLTGGHLYFVVHPGTGGTGRPWPATKYIAVIKKICSETGLRCFVTGTLEEVELAESVASASGATSLAGKTDILTLAAILKRSQLLLVGSTGTLHIGASQQTPIVLIEPTPDSAQRIAKWAPWMSPHRSVGASAVCQGCNYIQCHQTGKECTDSISVDQVFAASMELISEVAARKLTQKT